MLDGPGQGHAEQEGFIDVVAAQATDEPSRVVFWETAEDYEAYCDWRVETGFVDAEDAGSIGRSCPRRTFLIFSFDSANTSGASCIVSMHGECNREPEA